MTEAKKRFDELDGLKIFFALGVVLYHYWYYEGENRLGNCPKLSAFVYVHGYLGVEFFFILSGFLMEHTYRKIIDGLSFPQFMGRRLKSLYAPYLCAECLGIFVVFLDYLLCQGQFLFYKRFPITVANIVRSFSMTFQGWNYGQHPFIIATWFINVLVLCYALYFAVLRLAKRCKINPVYLYITLMLFAWGFHQLGSNFPFLLYHSTRGYWCFFVGCILYNIHKSGMLNKKIYILALDFIVLFFLLVGHKFGIPEIFGDVRLSFVFLIFPVLILTAENLPIAKKIFSCKILTFASRYSMDIYLTHVAVLYLTLIFNKYFGWNLNFASYKVLGCILLAIFALAFVWHQLMAIVTPAFNRWFVSFIAPAKAEKPEA
ncbi:MAG: acyltransferase [Spirochaetaceae bacterium]|nr:acyltransferase [Spirochaetaceae bacterium]